MGPLTGQVTHPLRVEHMQGLRGLPGTTPAGLDATATAWSAGLGACRGCLLVLCHVADGPGLFPTSQRLLTQELPLSTSPFLTSYLHRTTASSLHLGSCCHSGAGSSPGWAGSSWFPRQNRTSSTNAAHNHMPARPSGSVFSWPRGLCWPSPSGLTGHCGLHQASVCPGTDGPRAGAEAWGVRCGVDGQRPCLPVSRLEERESEMKKEYNALHQRHTEVSAQPWSARMDVASPRSSAVRGAGLAGLPGLFFLASAA